MSEACGNEPFALQVLGDSMEPEFKDGHIIVIDPEAVVKNGAYVFAVHDKEYIFRQLQIEGENYYLKPLNDKYPTLEILGLDQVQGVIIQGGGVRRRDRKKYE
ncbi:S24 family peptidase [Candidatus Venteria ishoeyi]|uniref:Putative HTH-type transcriptional regulator n=1 Tax=Candidatus Venteria ishoeyi TaxID=1899563 RepID=A0A1H6FFZ2_9GAMM|nr:S24 family peptidase [Candidatus Venteria ishoeyi]SEH08957.1 putative HTH-type transcriptional regulator [Candidatus Venteria ishoeyi]